jgi:hypothetical protein
MLSVDSAYDLAQVRITELQRECRRAALVREPATRWRTTIYERLATMLLGLGIAAAGV